MLHTLMYAIVSFSDMERGFDIMLKSRTQNLWSTYWLQLCELYFRHKDTHIHAQKEWMFAGFLHVKLSKIINNNKNTIVNSMKNHFKNLGYEFERKMSKSLFFYRLESECSY